MTSLKRHLQAAQDYLELGMALEANEEIESIPPDLKTLSEVLTVRAEIFRVLAKWDLMEAVAWLHPPGWQDTVGAAAVPCHRCYAHGA